MNIKRLGAGLSGLAAMLLMAVPAHAIDLGSGWQLNAKFFADFSLADTDADSGFHLKRNYLMLQGGLDSTSRFRLTLDQRAEDDRVFVKHAYLDKRFAQGFTVNGGLIGTPYVPWDEKNFWGYRFVERSFTDYWRLQSSADLGMSIRGTFGQQNLEYHVAVLNGEGYQNTPDGNGFALTGRLGAGVQGAQVGGFIHTENDRNGVGTYDPFQLGAYCYFEKQGVFRVGGQYVHVDDDTGFNNDFGINVQGRFKLPKVGSDTWLFARLDKMDVTNAAAAGFTTAPNGKNDLLIVGVSFKAANGLTVAPNYKRFDSTVPADGTEQVIGLHAQLTF